MAVLTRSSLISKADELITVLGGDAKAVLRARGIDPLSIDDFDRYVRHEDAAAVLGMRRANSTAPTSVYV